jgi:protease IV
MSDNQINDFSATSRQVPPPINNNMNDNFNRFPSSQQPMPAKKNNGCLIAGIIGGITIFTIFTLFIILAIIASLLGDPSKPNFTEKYISGDEFSENKIAVIDISGVILTDGPAGKVVSARTICEQLRYVVRDDSEVKAVILRINSPGGGVVASDMIHQAILRLREEHQMPVIAVMETVAASGGYYIAVASDHIIANRLTITGSIGVIAQSYNFHKLLEKIGVSGTSFKSGSMKDMLNPAKPRNPEADAIMQQLIDTTYNEFVNIVAAGRKELTVKQIKDSVIGDSRILDGTQAYKLKLVDQLGYFEDAVAVAAKRAKLGEDYVVVRYQPPFSLANIFQFKAPVDKLKIELPGNGKIAAELKPGQLYFLPTGL